MSSRCSRGKVSAGCPAESPPADFLQPRSCRLTFSALLPPLREPSGCLSGTGAEVGESFKLCANRCAHREATKGHLWSVCPAIGQFFASPSQLANGVCFSEKAPCGDFDPANIGRGQESRLLRTQVSRYLHALLFWKLASVLSVSCLIATRLIDLLINWTQSKLQNRFGPIVFVRDLVLQFVSGIDRGVVIIS